MSLSNYSNIFTVVVFTRKNWKTDFFGAGIIFSNTLSNIDRRSFELDG